MTTTIIECILAVLPCRYSDDLIIIFIIHARVITNTNDINTGRLYNGLRRVIIFYVGIYSYFFLGGRQASWLSRIHNF